LSDIDDDLEDQEAAEVLVTSIKNFFGERCCVFTESDHMQDIIHGKILAFIREWPAIVVRDITPGVEIMQRKRLIPVDAIRDTCFCPKKEKCQQCETFATLQLPPEDPPNDS
jgi:hypothetical protein